MESVSLRLYSDAYPCDTGKHPNINVKTQIPLELISIRPIYSAKDVYDNTEK